MNNKEFYFNAEKNTFSGTNDFETITNSLNLPMSITLQVTRKCNLECIYCSEDAQLTEPTNEMIHQMIDNISGIERVIVAGGEPTLRRDLPEILDYLKEKKFPVVSIASNAVLINKDFAAKLSRSLDYADITIDGTPESHNKIRGQFDKVVQGINNLKEAGVPVSIVNVLLSDNMKDVIAVCRMAEQFGARKLKILSPIRKGRGSSILDKRLSADKLSEIFDTIKKTKEEENWKVRITLTDWDIVNEGHAILIHPDGELVASPVPSNLNCIEPFGNVLEEDIRECWKRYRFVKNHVRKYLEESLLVC